jgi:hypothetical protein
LFVGSAALITSAAAAAEEEAPTTKGLAADTEEGRRGGVSR